MTYHNYLKELREKANQEFQTFIKVDEEFQDQIEDFKFIKPELIERHIKAQENWQRSQNVFITTYLFLNKQGFDLNKEMGN